MQNFKILFPNNRHKNYVLLHCAIHEAVKAFLFGKNELCIFLILKIFFFFGVRQPISAQQKNCCTDGYTSELEELLPPA
jgi:hypothetical protein